jgi:hypothetical protein
MELAWAILEMTVTTSFGSPRVDDVARPSIPQQASFQC